MRSKWGVVGMGMITDTDMDTIIMVMWVPRTTTHTHTRTIMTTDTIMAIRTITITTERHPRISQELLLRCHPTDRPQPHCVDCHWQESLTASIARSSAPREHLVHGTAPL